MNIYIVSTHGSNSLVPLGFKQLLEQEHYSNITVLNKEEIGQQKLDSDALFIISVGTPKEKMPIIDSTIIEPFFRQENNNALMVVYDGTITNADIKSLASRQRIGIVSSLSDTAELKECISKMLHTNSIVLCQHTQGILLQSILGSTGVLEDSGGMTLTKTEEAIIDASKQGLSIKEIAEKLQLSPNTVAAYRSKILRKSGARSMNQLLHKLDVSATF